MTKQTKILLLVYICVFAPRVYGGDDLAKKAKARLYAAEKAYKRLYESEEKSPSYQTDLVYQLSVRWLSAELELATSKEQRVSAYSSHLQRMKSWEHIFDGSNSDGDNLMRDIIDSYQKEAEYWLAKEREPKK